MSADHNVSDFFVADASQEIDSWFSPWGQDEVLGEGVQCLLQVDGFWSGTCNYEIQGGMLGEEEGKGGDEEVGAFVVEEAGDDDYGYGGSGGEGKGGVRGWGKVGVDLL